MPDFLDHNSLMNAIENDIFVLLDEVSDDIVNIVQESVQTNVYEAHTPKIYKRRGMLGGFIGAWRYELNQSTKFEMSSEIYNDPSLLDLDYSEYVHGGNDYLAWGAGSKSYVDRREMLDQIIAEGAQAGEFDFLTPGESLDNNWWLRPRDYWSPVFEELDSLGEFENSVMRSFFRNGIDVIKKI